MARAMSSIDVVPASEDSDDDDVVEVLDDLLEGTRPSSGPTRTRRRVMVDWACVNPQCPSGTTVSRADLTTAARHTAEYFGVKADARRKRKACAKCKDVAELALQEQIKKIKRGERFLPSNLPLPTDVMTLDLDDDSATDSSSCSEVEFNEEDLDLEGILAKLNLQRQVDMSTKALEARLDEMDNDFKSNNAAYKDMEKEMDDLREMLYQPFRKQISAMPAVDIMDRSPGVAFVGRPTSAVMRPRQPSFTETMQSPRPHSQSASSRPPPPNRGLLERPLPVVGEKVFALRFGVFDPWMSGSIVEVDNARQQTAEPFFKVRFEVAGSSGRPRTVQTKVLPRKRLAYDRPASVRLEVGTRIIAVYKDPEKMNDISTGKFFSGIIAEPPVVNNSYRYLVFFDDGYPLYVEHKDVRVVCIQSRDVSEDVHKKNREFIHKYVSLYPQRPMVRLSVNQIVRTEWEGEWLLARVMAVDASIVKLQYQKDGLVEYLYRGSTRLGPLYKELQLQQQQTRLAQVGVSPAAGLRRHNHRANEPFVEYTCLEATSSSGAAGVADDDPSARRAVAKKSTGAARRALDEAVVPSVASAAAAATARPQEGIVAKTEVECRPGRKYEAHECGPSCVEGFEYREADHREKNPLMIPLTLGWTRQVTKKQTHGKKSLFYVAPCGRRMSNMSQVHKYLQLTGIPLEVDFFSFEWSVFPFNEFKPKRMLCDIRDISYGKESSPVSCVNAIDNNYPEYIEYSTVRLPQNGVHINTEEDFLVCCDCTDDCADKDKCACWQLTFKATNANPDNVVNTKVGYDYRRLKEQVPTGIYECNAKCKCSKKTCLNRVAQHPLRAKLQVFKTAKRGWGLRTLCEIPRGSFICIYVGNLYTNEEANEKGKEMGDEYFAELDLIEAVERNKEGYESDVDEDEDQNADGNDNGSAELSPFENGVARLSNVANVNNDDDDEYVEDSSSSTTEDEDDPPMGSREVDEPVVMPGVLPSSDACDRQTRSRNARTGHKLNLHEGDDDEEEEDEDEESESGAREIRNFGVSVTQGPPKTQKSEPATRLISTRKMYGHSEDQVYIMDAKTKGNIGRYMNHSCVPNVFVQNCFVDTHDLRFPWVAFFALSHIRAGEELCWDYAYIEGQVQGKEIYCECGANGCRGRLL